MVTDFVNDLIQGMVADFVNYIAGRPCHFSFKYKVIYIIIILSSSPYMGHMTSISLLPCECAPLRICRRSAQDGASNYI